MDRRKLAGRSGEAEAAKYLRSQGYELLGMNYACRAGEIDIIAARDGFVAFVEVKLRADARFAQAREAVTPAKQRRIKLAALEWLSTRECELQPRFDVIEIYTRPGEDRIIHLENAFE